MENRSINVFLANDHQHLRAGIRRAFNTHAPHIQIVEEAENFQDLLKKLPNTEFDILMLDDIMQGESILTYLPGIREENPEMRIILNSIFTEEVPHLKKAKRWVNGWLSFSSSKQNFVKVVEAVYGGGLY